ncbi:glycine-rich protein [Natronolimnohabitans sp. A-GB9]|uniref:glycine-rich protein n=1 Tax=Natronolimnohabitans sp. A-GB9 TaxID=3069757 RepID=UPI0027B047B7|nr:glycine-rich protein [Natronolimnohabitans sp. A-GB9]MDQ2052939.1 glycine-rich protein [Natronolimnohabitans sp. A-GB9]
MVETYDTPGEYQLEAPDNAVYAHIEAWGGDGAGGYDDSFSSDGGDAGYIDALVPVDPGEHINVTVAGGADGTSGGYNGGGDGSSADDSMSGGGGGASDIRIGGETLEDRVLVAAGGAGGAGGGRDGGDGGAEVGETGRHSLSWDVGGEGGSQTSGGAPGEGGDNPGEFGVGGDGDSASFDDGASSAGAGGGGWYGGGGGGIVDGVNGGGGGGSNYLLDAGDALANERGESADNDGDGTVSVEFVTSDPPADLGVTDWTDDTVTLSWDDSDVDDHEAIRIYRSETSPVPIDDEHLVKTVDASETTAVDDTVDDYTEYHYVVTAVVEVGETDPSNEASVLTDVHPPTFESLEAQSNDDLVAEWAVESDAGDEHKLEVSLDGESWDVVATVDGSAKTASWDGALDGRVYTGRIRVIANSGAETREATSDTLYTTTDLPNPESYDLDATDLNQLTVVNLEPRIDNGEYRVRWTRTATDEDWNEATYAYDDEIIITGLLNGEEYDVEVRPETEDVIGDWLDETVVSLLEPNINLGVTSTEPTTVEIDWTTISNFDGVQEIWRARNDYDYDDPKGELIATLEADTESFTDDVQPDRDYHYTTRAQTAYTHADADVETTTDSAGLEQSPVPPRGWYAEVIHPNGQTLMPQILSEAGRNPTINGYPRVEIPTPYDDSWHSDALNDADMRVWHDGDRQPIERLEHRSLEEGGSDKQTVLEGKGGTQLEHRVVEDVDLEPTHELVKRLLNEYTDYDYVVDEPIIDEESVTLQTADEAVELEMALVEAILEQITNETIPLEITDDGRIVPLQTCHVFDQDDGDFDEEYSGGRAGNPSMWGSGSFDYTVPVEHIGYAIREGKYDETDDIEYTFNSNEFLSWSLSGRDSIEWYEVSGWLQNHYNEDVEGFNWTITGDSEYTADIIAIFDARYHDPNKWDNEVHEPDGYLDDPPLYPERLDLDLEPIATPLPISDLTLEVEMDDGEPAISLGLGIDGTDEFDEAAEVTTHTIDYDVLSTTAQPRISLAHRRGLEPREQTPRLGYEPQGLDALSLDATLDSTPVVTNRSFDGKLIDVLRKLADIGNFVFEVRTDDNDDLVVHWTQLEQRATDADPDLASYSVDKQTEDVVERAIIYGGAQRVSRQPIDVEIGEWIDLPFSDARLVEGRETVYEGDTEYSRADDYQIRYTTEDGQPRLRALEDGDLEDRQTVRIDADVKPRGEHVQADVVDPAEARTVIEDIPALATQQMCEQVALYLVEETGRSIVEAEVVVPHDDVGWSIVEAVNINALPGDGHWQTREIDSDPTRTMLRLGQGQTVREAIQEIRDRTSQAEERV